MVLLMMMISTRESAVQYLHGTWCCKQVVSALEYVDIVVGGWICRTSDCQAIREKDSNVVLFLVCGAEAKGTRKEYENIECIEC